jgi:hypothetical protein
LGRNGRDFEEFQEDIWNKVMNKPSREGFFLPYSSSQLLKTAEKRIASVENVKIFLKNERLCSIRFLGDSLDEWSAFSAIFSIFI